MGRWSQWTVELEDKNSVAKLKSTKTGRFLGMKEANSIGVQGDGRSDADRWRVKKLSGGYTRLENKKFPGKYLGVSSDGRKVQVGTGGKLSRLQILQKGGRTRRSRRTRGTKSRKRAPTVRSRGRSR